jgi:hypothetical protein
MSFPSGKHLNHTALEVYPLAWFIIDRHPLENNVHNDIADFLVGMGFHHFIVMPLLV